MLFIVIDDLNVALGAYGHPSAKTPRLDRLAAAGVRFDRAYAQDPLCNPSRSSFLSGLRPATTGVYAGGTPPRVQVGDAVMLPEHFHRHGYFTARIGKVSHDRFPDSVSWDVSEDASPSPYDMPGVDHSEVRDNTWIEGAEHGLTRTQLLTHLGRSAGLPLVWRATDQREEDTPDGRTARRIIELLREHGSKPFFIAAGFHKPHQPWVAPSAFFRRHPIAEVELPREPGDDRDDIPAAALTGYPDDAAHTDEQKRQAIAAYHATVSLVDHEVGLLLDALDELHLADSTVVLVVSDHGFHLGEHGGLWRKHTQFEEATRVPLLVRAPGGPAGVATRGLVELVDLYPTLADLCSLPAPEGLEGISFAPLLHRPDRDWKSAVFSEVKRGGAHGRSVRTSRYRYTEWRPIEGGDAELELYDLEEDPHELRNLARRPGHEALLQDMAARLAAGWRKALPS